MCALTGILSVDVVFTLHVAFATGLTKVPTMLCKSCLELSDINTHALFESQEIGFLLLG